MKGPKTPLIIRLAVAVSATLLAACGQASSSIDYQGQKIKLSKSYASFEDYKDDPDNIDPSENARVAELVEHARIQHQFSGSKDFGSALFELKFPGYGLGIFPGEAQPDGTKLELYTVEIPRGDKSRFLTFRNSRDLYTLLDDFVDSDLGGTHKVRLENGLLVYSLENGKRTLTHAIVK